MTTMCGYDVQTEGFHTTQNAVLHWGARIESNKLQILRKLLTNCGKWLSLYETTERCEQSKSYFHHFVLRLASKRNCYPFKMLYKTTNKIKKLSFFPCYRHRLMECHDFYCCSNTQYDSWLPQLNGGCIPMYTERFKFHNLCNNLLFKNNNYSNLPYHTRGCLSVNQPFTISLTILFFVLFLHLHTLKQ